MWMVSDGKGNSNGIIGDFEPALDRPRVAPAPHPSVPKHEPLRLTAQHGSPSPWMNIFRRYGLPRLLMPATLAFLRLPLRGTNPSSRKLSPLVNVARRRWRDYLPGGKNRRSPALS